MIKALAALSATFFSFQAIATGLEAGSLIDLETSPIEVAENGCANGTYDWTISADSQYLNVRFFDFNVPTGRVDATGSRTAEKRCDLIGRFRIPAGYTVGVESAGVRATVNASDRDSGGFMGISYAPANERWPATILNQSYVGPIGREVSAFGRLPHDRMLFTRCASMDTEQNIILSSVLSTRASTFGESTIDGQSNSGAIMQEYRFVWLRCGQPGPGPGPGPGSWYGSCRIVLETIWGQDVREFFGSSHARTEAEAIRVARNAGLNTCERFRANDSLHRCVTDTNNCFATR